MRLNIYRSGGTLRYDADGNAIWYVVDEDAPGEQKYAAKRYGTIVECAQYIQEQEHAEALAQEQAAEREQEWIEATSHPSYYSNNSGE